MATRKGFKVCPVCKESRPISYFARPSNGVLRVTCSLCLADGSTEAYVLGKVSDQQKEITLNRFRAVFECRQAGGEAPPKKQERRFWNLTADPWPDMFKGRGLHANYCPLM